MQSDRVSWLEMRDFVDTRNLSIQVLVRLAEYKLVAVDTFFMVEHIMDRQPSDPTELLDFETNYLPFANGQIGLQRFTTGRRLLVDVDSDPTSSAPAPVYPNSLAIDWGKIQLKLNDNSTGLKPVYSYTGSGKLDSFTLELNSDKIFIKLVVDSKVIFDIDCHFLDKLQDNSRQVDAISALTWTNNDVKSLIFKPRYPILYNSSVDISAVANDNSTDREVERYMISIVKDS